jgi:hypothetical protein
MTTQDLPEPPPPPDTQRRAKLYPYQWVGLAFLTILPLLAWVGLLGESWAKVSAAGATLEVVVSYPNRLRYWQVNQVELQIRNTSATPLDSVRVALDSAFAFRFANLTSVPPFEKAFTLAIERIPPNESRPVVIELRADRFGRHSGTVTIAGADTVRVPLSIMVYP